MNKQLFTVLVAASTCWGMQTAPVAPSPATLSDRFCLGWWAYTKQSEFLCVAASSQEHSYDKEVGRCGALWGDPQSGLQHVPNRMGCKQPWLVDTKLWMVDTTFWPVDTTFWLVYITFWLVDTTLWLVDTTFLG